MAQIQTSQTVLHAKLGGFKVLQHYDGLSIWTAVIRFGYVAFGEQGLLAVAAE